MPKDDEMTRLSKAKQERNARLREIWHNVPADTDISRYLFSLLLRANAFTGLPSSEAPDSDRHAAIASAAAVEHALRGAISRHLYHDADTKAVFEDYPNAPLSSFSSRITMARALGVVTDDDERDLGIIKKVRNQFAHTMMPISFSQPDIASLIAEIKVLDDPYWHDLGDFTAPRARYITSCALYHRLIEGHKFLRPDNPNVLVANTLKALVELEASRKKSPPQSHPENKSEGRKRATRRSPPAPSRG
jgi:hypothetical protein